MRKIEKDMLRAIRNRKNWRCENTEVVVTDETVNVYLHENRIVRYWPASMMLDMTLCGWPTVTTRSRLNAITEAALGYRMWSQCGGQQYYGEIVVGDEHVITIGEVQL